jgi:hypothetical protein
MSGDSKEKKRNKKVLLGANGKKKKEYKIHISYCTLGYKRVLQKGFVTYTKFDDGSEKLDSNFFETHD